MRSLVPAVAVVAALALAGCSSSGDTSSEAPSDADSSIGATEPGMPGRLGGGDDAAGAAADRDIATDSLLAGQAVIVTASVALEDADPQRTRDRVTALATTYGGRLADEASFTDRPDITARIHLVLRVPADRLDALVDQLRTLTTVVESHRTSEDVTLQVVDINARVKSRQAALDRLRTFLTQTQDIDTLVRVESELADREAELESLLAQQKYLADQTAMSTLTVTIAAPTEKPSEAGFLSGLEDGWDAFVSALRVGATALGAVLPFAAVLAVIGVPIWLTVRRRRRPAFAGPTDSPGDGAADGPTGGAAGGPTVGATDGEPTP